MNGIDWSLLYLDLPNDLSVEEARERLGLSGAGVDSCCDGREAGKEQGTAEARSEKRHRVAPVQALVRMVWELGVNPPDKLLTETV